MAGGGVANVMLAGGFADSSVPPPRRARPWLAALLTLLQPGLGHVYAWRPGRAIAIWVVAFACVMSAALIVARTPGRWPIVLFAAVVLAVYLTILLSAWRTARAQHSARPRRWVLTLALIAFLISTSQVSGLVARWIKRDVAEAFRIPSWAMEPTVLAGDWLFVRPRKGEPVRDRLYTFQRDGELFLMRVVGLPGDTLWMEAARLIRNGGMVPEPYTQIRGAPYGSDAEFEWQRSHEPGAVTAASVSRTVDDWGPFVVPPGTVFILGDNRHMALDGRYKGPTAVDSVLGEPTHVYFSIDPEGGVRWRRIGTRLQ